MPRINSNFPGCAILALVILPASHFYAESPSATGAPAKCVKLINQPVVFVDQATGLGSATLLLSNQLKVPVTLDLTAAFVPTLASQTLVEFADTEKGLPSPIFERKLAPLEKITVFLTVKDAWSDGQQDIELYNHFGKETMGKIHVLRVSLALEDPKLNLNLVYGDTTRILLKNDEAVTYHRVHWELINGHVICDDGGKEFDIQANSTTILSCTPRLQWNPSWLPEYLVNKLPWRPGWTADAVKWPGLQDGYRFVLYENRSVAPSSSKGSLQPQEQSDPIVQLASFPGKASLDFFRPTSRIVVKYIVIFIVLAMGGLASLFLSYYIPNKLQRLDLRDKLLALAIRTSNLSTRISSRLAVLVRLERSRLSSLLEKRLAISPDFAAVAALCTAGIAQLDDKVTILEQTDIVLGLLEQRQTEGAPPTRVDQINAALEDANVRLDRSEMTPDDIAKAAGSVDLAMTIVSKLQEEDAAFGQSLFKDCQKLVRELKQLDQTGSYSAIHDRVGFALNMVAGVNAPVVQADYVDIDYALQKSRIVLRYVRLRESVTDPEVRKRLDGHRTNLLTSYLQRKSWAGLKAARLLIREMEDDIYPEKIAEKIIARLGDDQSREVVIEIDPDFVYESAPIDFSLRFYSQEYDSCSAREEFKVVWNFDDGHEGEGWTASHYFLPRQIEWTWRTPPSVKGETRWYQHIARYFHPDNRNSFTVIASVYDPNGKLISIQGNASAVLRYEVHIHPSALFDSSERTRVEAIKLSAALAVAIVGLLSGAQAQIDKLDLIPGIVAVFLLGFGADSIKRLLTSTN